MRNTLLAVATVVMMLATPRSATPQERLPGTEEFGLSERELVEKIESVEALMAKCMREHGFQAFLAPLIGGAIGLVSGTYPALRAAHLEPVEAFRN